MSDPTIGIIGTGDFAAYLVSALRKGGHSGRIILSPYSQTRAQSLATAGNCEISTDDQALTDQADWILLSVRPEQLVAVLPKLRLRDTQTLISAVAGVTIASLRSSLRINSPIVRIMPSSYIGVIDGGLFPLFPSSGDINRVFERAGKVLVLDREDDLDLAMVGACLAGFTYSFASRLERWFVDHGMEASKARDMVAGNLLGAAGNALANPGISLDKISDRIATPGTYTRLGLEYLRSRDSFETWAEALSVIDLDLKSKTPFKA
ncbi:pyrroline-5-carboxylate reductase family protein [Rhizobium leguminosarum]|uniref:pyrroline-5-carboxylate reductase family protein n=1 Tax=Rhizobium leguminosarum TaxID=384 RepID=UPI001559C5BE|nr:NAD(P)-binding domain-containing protein [Rhizobium leguminosarum]